MFRSPQLYRWVASTPVFRFQFGGRVWVYVVVPVKFRSNCRPVYLMDEFHGLPPAAHDPNARASCSLAEVTAASRMMTVLSRTPETAGHGWVVRIVSANRQVLLVPSVTPRIGTPLNSWPPAT